MIILIWTGLRSEGDAGSHRISSRRRARNGGPNTEAGFNRRRQEVAGDGHAHLQHMALVEPPRRITTVSSKTKLHYSINLLTIMHS